MPLLRACKPEELPELTQLADRVFRPGGGSMGAEYPLVFGEEDLEYCRVIEEDGRLVSHVGLCIRDARILGCLVRLASIGAVCTDANCRGLFTPLAAAAGVFMHLNYLLAAGLPRNHPEQAQNGALILIDLAALATRSGEVAGLDGVRTGRRDRARASSAAPNPRTETDPGIAPAPAGDTPAPACA